MTDTERAAAVYLLRKGLVTQAEAGRLPDKNAANHPALGLHGPVRRAEGPRRLLGETVEEKR